MTNPVVNHALKSPGKVFAFCGVALAAILLAVALPFLVPQAPLYKLTIDTNPENMLSASEPARLFNADRKEQFSLHDSIVIAVENDRTNHGVFTPDALADIKSLTDFAASLDGVLANDIVSPDRIETLEMIAGHEPRAVPVMQGVPSDQAAASAIQDRLMDMPELTGTLVSNDGEAMTVVIPIADKSEGRRISRELKSHIAEQSSGNHYSITGLPVAQSVFGVEMFIQMAVAAPAAMLLIFVLLLVLFRSWWAAAVPLAIAMVSTIGAMGALVITGQTIHIMSSMIPIFVMPIAVMDAIHVLSEFADRHQPGADRRQTIRACMKTLWRPMLFTTITTMAGFASLALAPIPPVQIFGLFVALGVLFAWFSTVVLVPAALTRVPERAIEKIVRANRAAKSHWTGRISLARPRLLIAVLAGVAIVLFAGLGRIHINDTPMRWFASDHPIRTAENVLTDRFAGAHQAFLTLEGKPGTFLQPEVLTFVNRLEEHSTAGREASKSFSLNDLLGSAHKALGGDVAGQQLPDTQTGITALIEGLEQAGKSDDLAKLMSADASELVIRFQMPNGDNQSMRALETRVAQYLRSHPMPERLTAGWFGLTYLNAVWQDRMVSGMLNALIGSFIAVLVLLVILFRSLSWAVLSMIPLTFAIGGTYGAIGWIGRDFDMPIAVLSTLSLGLAVDFAIHFVSRIREGEGDTLLDRLHSAYQEPARAIERNTIVLGVGFLPLLLSPLIPYRTVGVLIPTIIVISAVATLIVLGALVAAGQKGRERRSLIDGNAHSAAI